MNFDWKTIAAVMKGKLRSVPQTPFSGVSIDSRTTRKGQLYFALSGDRFDGHDFAQAAIDSGAASIVIKPNTCSNISAGIIVDDPLTSMQLFSGYMRSLMNIPIVAITGSHGKTTTKDILAGIFKKYYTGALSTFHNLNGLIGVPLTLLKLKTDTPALVIEVGISIPGEMELLAPLVRPTIAIFTCVAQAHSEFLPSLDIIFQEKSHLMDNVKAGGNILLNADDKILMRNQRWNNTVTFGLKSGDFRGSLVKSVDNKTEMHITAPDNNNFSVTLPMVGQHNASNAVAACAAARLLGIPVNAVQDGIKDLEMSPHRSSIIKHQGITIIDDVYNAAPKSMSMALDILQHYRTSGRRIAVLGDMLELGQQTDEAHRQLANKIINSKPDVFFAFGKHIETTYKIVADTDIPCKFFSDSSQAGYELAKFIISGDLVLIKSSRSMHGERIIYTLLEN